MKKVIGVTGGVGSGKSTVLRILENEYQAQIIMADPIAHQVMVKGEECYQPIVDRYGTQILTDTGELDRQKMSERIFSDKTETDWVNQLVHPVVKERIRQQIAASSNELVAVEAALFIEAGYQDLCDELWYVYVCTQERVKRLYEQRGYSEVKSYSIIHKQLNHEQFSRACDRLVDNGGSVEETRRQIAAFLAGNTVEK